MEQIIGYIILFTIGLSVLYAYQWRKSKKRGLLLSEQNYTHLILSVMVQKMQGKTQEIHFRVVAKKPLVLSGIMLELIDRKRNFHVFKLKLIEDERKEEIALGKDQNHTFTFAPDTIKNFILSKEIVYKSFRFIVEDSKGKKYKSHELAFNKHWSLYKPDTGRYN